MSSQSQFDAATQKELAQFLEREQAQARIQSTVQNLTDMCWEKCIVGSSFGRFSSKEESCLNNCVDRFLDTSLFMVKKLQQKE